jgi:hypothetical protein
MKMRAVSNNDVEVFSGPEEVTHYNRHFLNLEESNYRSKKNNLSSEENN